MEAELEKQLEALAELDQLKRELVRLHETRASNTVRLRDARKAHMEGIKSLKSDLKKSTALVKKLRAVTADGLVNCIKDTETLNLNLYISEIVTAVLETNFKVADVPSLVRLCGCLHQRYDEFSQPLISGLMESLLSNDSGDKEEMKKKRIQLRFAIELFQEGVLADDEVMIRLFRKITCKTKGVAANQQIDLISLTAFVKFGAESIFGYTTKRMASLCAEVNRPLSEYPLKVITATSTQNELKMILSEVYEQLSRATVDAHKDMTSKDKRFEKDRVLHGSLSEAKQLELDNAKRLFEKLMAAVTSISENTGDPMPVLQVDKESVDASKGISVWEGAAALGDYGPYEDAESKSFYEDLPDLLSMVPLAALGFSPEQAAALREQWAADDADRAVDEDDTVDEALLGGADEEGREDATDKPDATDKTAVDAEDTPQIRVAALLEEKLPEATSKQRAVDFCVSFCYLNSKAARKKLVAALLKLNRNRYELFPTYSRIIASLHRLFPLDLAAPVLEELQRQFYGNFKAKSQFFIENKLKTVRYVGELVKFKIAPPILAFRMMKLLLSDLTRHNVELLTSLLETCGRYLYLLPATQERMNETLRTMLRLRSIKNLDLHQQSLIEAAYFTVKPPERVKKVVKELSPLQKYIRYLLSSKLESCVKPGTSRPSKEHVEELIKLIRRLPWTNPAANVDIEVVKAALKTTRKKYVNIPILADCLSGLSSYRPNFLVRLVDTALEEIQHEIEEPHKSVHQRTIGLTKLIGELYNYSALSSAVVFDLLYGLVKYVSANAQTSDWSVLFASKIGGDAENSSDNFRIQLVAELLNTTGAYYVSGNAKVKLLKFLAIFQKFLLCRPGLPMHIEFCVLDLFDRLEELARDAAIKRLRKSAPKKKVQEIEDSVVGLFFPRYDTMEAVDAAIAEFESHEDFKREDDAREPMEEEEESGDEDDCDEDDDDSSGEEDSEVEEEDEEDEGEISAAEASRMLEKMRVAEEEDDEFEKAYRSVMQDSLETASKSMGGSKVVDVNMARPAILPKPKNVFARFDGEDEDAEDALPKGVPFKLLSRDGKGRIESRQLVVPEDSLMSIKLAKAEAAKKEERDRLKQLVLMRDEVDEDAEAEIGALESRRLLQNMFTNTNAPLMQSSAGGRGRGRSQRSRDGARFYDRSSGSDMGLSDFLAESNAADVKKIQGRLSQSDSAGRGAPFAGRGRGPSNV